VHIWWIRNADAVPSHLNYAWLCVYQLRTDSWIPMIMPIRPGSVNSICMAFHHGGHKSLLASTAAAAGISFSCKFLAKLYVVGWSPPRLAKIPWPWPMFPMCVYYNLCSNLSSNTAAPSISRAQMPWLMPDDHRQQQSQSCP